jgi:hypothetical protein
MPLHCPLASDLLSVTSPIFSYLFPSPLDSRSSVAVDASAAELTGDSSRRQHSPGDKVSASIATATCTMFCPSLPNLPKRSSYSSPCSREYGGRTFINTGGPPSPSPLSKEAFHVCTIPQTPALDPRCRYWDRSALHTWSPPRHTTPRYSAGTYLWRPRDIRLNTGESYAVLNLNCALRACRRQDKGEPKWYSCMNEPVRYRGSISLHEFSAHKPPSHGGCRNE